MRSDSKFVWFLTVPVATAFVIFAITALLFWNHLAPDEKAIIINSSKQNFGYIFIAAFLLISIVAFAFDGILHLYILPLKKLTEEAALITSVNPSHRIKTEGGQDLVRLSHIINGMADRVNDSWNDFQDQINHVKEEAEEERNILAAIMGELPEGVIICNVQGKIILYNRQAKYLLGVDSKEKEIPGERISQGDNSFIGLGRSIFGIIDQNLIVHALDEINSKLKQKENNVVSLFVLVNKKGWLLRVEAVPILNHKREFAGFILVIYDITQQLEKDNLVEFILESLAKDIRSSLASIRATIEAILKYPDMEKEKLNQFREIILNESITIGTVLDKMVVDYSEQIQSKWPLVQMPAKDLLAVLQKKSGKNLNIMINVEMCGEKLWVKVDSYSFVLAVMFVLDRVKIESGTRDFQCRFHRKGQFAHIDFKWVGKKITMDILRKWYEQTVQVGNEIVPMTLKEVIRHHEGDIWPYISEKKSDKVSLRFVLPVSQDYIPEATRNVTILPDSRPEFYDFDLFDQAEQKSEMDDCLLTDLTYTVFDTETTGLNIKAGDEIISIGAVRIVNGRLLRDEWFDQLVDPERSIPWESVAIHGIQPEMLKGQPKIETALSRFYKFAEDTVLLAHNAAFDMRLLQLKEKKTGIKFTNPVLDTMLLSAFIHPAQKDHTIETIAKLLGIRVVGRHTALGDALATGEMFLKLIPLLAQKGIYSLKQARLASKKTFQARLKY
jgi:DNA polymerase-3 subunit epsilon